MQADPGNLEAHLSYADWLCEHGDPRGDLIILQCGHAFAPDQAGRLRCGRAAERILSDYADDLLIGPEDRIEHEWRYGFMRRVRIKRSEEIHTLLERLVEHRCAALLHDLTIDDADGSVVRELIKLAVSGHALPPTVRRLQLGSEEGWIRRSQAVSNPLAHIAPFSVGMLAGFVEELHALAVFTPAVRVATSGTGLASLDLTQLTHLEVGLGAARRGVVEEALELPALRSLRVVPGRGASRRDVVELIEAEPFAHIDTLSLRLPSGAWSEIARSPRAEQIRCLDVTGSALAADDIHEIVGEGSRFVNLERISGAWTAVHVSAVTAAVAVSSERGISAPRGIIA